MTVKFPGLAARPARCGNYGEFIQPGDIDAGTHFHSALIHSPLVRRALQEIQDRGVPWFAVLACGARAWAETGRDPATQVEVDVTSEVMAEWDDARRVAYGDYDVDFRLKGRINNVRDVERLMRCALQELDEWYPA